MASAMPSLHFVYPSVGYLYESIMPFFFSDAQWLIFFAMMASWTRPVSYFWAARSSLGAISLAHAEVESRASAQREVGSTMARNKSRCHERCGWEWEVSGIENISSASEGILISKPQTSVQGQISHELSYVNRNNYHPT